MLSIEFCGHGVLIESVRSGKVVRHLVGVMVLVISGHAPRDPAHTSWAFLLDTNPAGTPAAPVPVGEYGVAAITAVRATNNSREYYIHWHGYGRREATWESEHNVRLTECFQRLIQATPQMVEGRSTARSASEWRHLQRKGASNEGDDSGHPHLSSIASTRLRGMYG